MRVAPASLLCAVLTLVAVGCDGDDSAAPQAGSATPVAEIVEQRSVIDFDKLPGGATVDGLAANGAWFPGTLISNQYASLGALFSSVNGSPIATEGGVGPAGVREGSVNAKSSPNFLVGNPSSLTAIVVTFADPAGSGSPAAVTGRIEATIVSIGSNPHRIRAFDLAGNEIATVTIPAGEAGPGWYNHTPAGIDVVKAARLHFEVVLVSVNDGHGIDDLSFPMPKVP